MQTGEGCPSPVCVVVYQGGRVLQMMLLNCKANPSLASSSRVHGDRIQFWTTDDLHDETPFDDAELGEGCVRDEDTQGFGVRWLLKHFRRIKIG